MSNLDDLFAGDPALTIGVDRLTGIARGRHVFAGWAFGNFMDDESQGVTTQDHSMVDPPAGNPQDVGTVADTRECGGSQ